MIYRQLIEDLEKWSQRPNRKPLVLRGARQVGKTTLIDEFGKLQFIGLIGGRRPQVRTRSPKWPTNCSLYPIVVILSAIGHYGIKSSLFFRTFAFRIKNVRHKAIDYQ